MQFERTVGGARFEQQHAHRRDFAEPRRESRARRPGADDDVVGLEVAPAGDASCRRPRSPRPRGDRLAAHAPNAFTSTTDIFAQFPSMRNRVKPSQTAAPVRDVTNHGGFGSTDSP